MAVVTEKPRAKPTARKPTAAAKPAARKAAGAAKLAPTKAAKPGAKHGTSPVRKAKAKAAKSTAKAIASPGSTTGTLARHAALKVLKHAGKRMMQSGGTFVRGATLARGATFVRGATERALDAASTATEPGAHRRPPIQASVDVAVPWDVAWAEWMTLEWVPDAAGEITGIRRGTNGDLRGKLRHDRWAAEITEVHEPHSFAWRAKRGSDCAGLITFHPLSDWLTRIELSLDAKPSHLGEAAALVSHRADRRTTAELRRFKARLELISPDEYEDEQDD